MHRCFSPVLAGLMLSTVAGAAADQAVPRLEVETLAVPVRTARMWQPTVAPDPHGGWNFIAEFMNYRGTTGFRYERVKAPASGREYVRFADPRARPDAEWVVLDLASGRARIFRLPGFHAVRSVRAENGRVFFAVDFFHVYYYEPADESIKILGQLAEWKPFTNDRVIYRFLVGPDGMVYATTQAYGGTTSLVRLNPDTLEYRVIHGVGTGKRKTRLTYGYYLGVDPPWAYVAVGQNEWELMAVHFGTGEVRCLARRTGPGARVVVSQGREAVTAELIGPDGKQVVWCVNGALLPARRNADGPLPFTPIARKRYARVEWKRTRPLAVGPAPVVDTAKATVGRDGWVTVPWRPADAPPEAWRTVRFRIESAEPVPIECLAALPDGSLFGSVAQYNGWFRYDPAKRACTYFGKHGPSQARLAVGNGRAYFCGYPNCNLWEYDPARPWTSQAGRARPGDRTTNPWLIGYFGQGVTEAHHCRFLIPGPNGRLYIGGERSRWSTGTGIGYYEFASGRKVGLGQALRDLAPEGMALLPGLGRVVVSGRILGEGGEAQLRVYDLDLKEVARLTVRRGLRSTGRLTPVAGADRLLGIVASQTGSALYLYDLKARSLVKWVGLDGGVTGRVFRRAADGTYWLLKGGDLCRVDPKTLALTPVGRLARPIREALWLGGSLYGADGGELVRAAVGLRPSGAK